MTAKTDYAFEIVDVFTHTSFAGNQLAVLPDARGLDTRQMQAIAREFNFAESTFVFPPENPANTAKVRIFTPAEEMPFAGHPNVGTGYVLARLGQVFGTPVADHMRFEELAGVVEIEVTRETGTVTGAWVKAPSQLVLGTEVGSDLVAGLSGISADDIITSRFKPRFASVGAEFLCAEVTPDALARARCNIPGFEAAEGRIGQTAGFLGLHLHARAAPGELEVRMFAPMAGVIEDAATGSAAAALGALLASVSPQERTFRMSQGRSIGRPSTLDVEIGPNGVRVGGPCAPFASGTLRA